MQLLCAALLCCLAFDAASAADRKACGVAENFANPHMLAAMRRGVNLPGWDDPDIARRPTPAQLQALRDEGFSHIRLPLDNRRLTGEHSETYLDAMVEQVVFLLSLDYAISLDLHPDQTVGQMFESDPGQVENYLSGLWRAIAPRVRHFDPNKIAVELLNEPQTDADTWRKTAAALIMEIRRILPVNTIVIGPSGPQRHEMLAAMRPFSDDNIVYAVHFYDPFAFTHQGADWGGPDDPIQHLENLPFPASAADEVMGSRIAGLSASGREEAATMLRLALDTPWTEDALAPAFDMMSAWSAKHSAPVIINEFGVLSHVAPRQSRLTWLAAVRRQAEKRCLGWAHWDFQDGFGLIDHGTGLPDEDIMRALVPAAE